MLRLNDCELVIYRGDNIEILDNIDKNFRLVYMDPPFNTGKKQTKKAIKITSVADNDGDRVGFKGKRYKSKIISNIGYDDKFDNLSDFLYPRIAKVYEKLTSDGSVFLHLDYREVHNVKVLVMDKIFGSNCFINEIIWSYDYGAKSKTKWSSKHDNILWYAKDSKNYVFNYNEIDRVPYMAPGLVSKEKAAIGKIITDVWWNTIVCGKEKTGYPTQKPRAILDRIVKVHSMPGDCLLDPFAGSGTFGESAMVYGRNCVLIDSLQDAIKSMEDRLDIWQPKI